MTAVSSDLTSSLSQAIHSSAAQLDDQKTFNHAVRAFQEQLLRDLNHTRVESQSFYSSLLRDLDVVVQRVIGRVTRSTQDVETKMQSLQEV